MSTLKAPFSSLDTHLPFPSLVASSPFAAPAPTDVPADAPEGSYTYALVQSAPSVPATECEIDAAAAEIVIRWGATTLHVAHLTPPRSFFVGEASEKDAVDFELPADRLGVARLPVVRKAADGPAFVVIPAGAKGTATLAGHVVKVSDLATGTHGQASAEIAGAFEVQLHAGTQVRFEIGGIEIEIASVNAGRKASGRFSFDRRSLPFQAVSMALHLGLLGAAAVFLPPAALASEDTLSHDQIDSLKMILSTTAERELDASPDASGGGDKGSRDDRPAHEPTARESGMGSVGRPGPKGRGGAPAAGDSVPLSRTEALAMARNFGMIGLLAGSAGNSAASPWGGSIGSDPRASLDAFGGRDLTETSGGGGLDLTGTGEGGDGDGTGIALDPTGMFGPSTGLHRFGPGKHGIPGHRPRGPSMRPEEAKVSSRIPAELIQRVVRQSFGRFRACYENGLRGNPSLAGRVSVRFVIGRDGSVMSASNGGSDLPDAGVVSCVVAGFRGLQFPQIEDASVATVVYPIVFAPAK